MSPDFEYRATACWYSWEDCYILNGAVDNNRNLYIQSEMLLKNTSIEIVANLLETDSKPWINFHPPLREALNNQCNEVNFDIEHLSEIAPLEDLFKCLKAENRLFLSKKVKEVNFANHSNCVKLLLKAFTKELCSLNQGFSGKLATVVQRRNLRYMRF